MELGNKPNSRKSSDSDKRNLVSATYAKQARSLPGSNSHNPPELLVPSSRQSTWATQGMPARRVSASITLVIGKIYPSVIEKYSFQCMVQTLALPDNVAHGNSHEPFIESCHEIEHQPSVRGETRGDALPRRMVRRVRERLWMDPGCQRHGCLHRDRPAACLRCFNPVCFASTGASGVGYQSAVQRPGGLGGAGQRGLARGGGDGGG
jgi:hypothetical protein